MYGTIEYHLKKIKYFDLAKKFLTSNELPNSILLHKVDTYILTLKCISIKFLRIILVILKKYIYYKYSWNILLSFKITTLQNTWKKYMSRNNSILIIDLEIEYSL